VPSSIFCNLWLETMYIYIYFGILTQSKLCYIIMYQF
jgi:hypothetical protein